MKIISAKNIGSTLLLILVLKYFSLIFSIDFLDPIQNTIEDFKITDIVFSDRPDDDSIPIDTNVVLINIGKLNRYGIAKEIEILNKYQPKVIAIDAFFTEEKEPKFDSTMAAVFAKTKNLVLVSELQDYNQKELTFDTITVSHPKFNKYATNGFANVVINESDFRTVRYFMTLGEYRDKRQHSFPVVVSRLFDSAAYGKLMDREKKIEIINYKRNADKYLSINYPEVFSGEKDLSFIKDKIVLMGYLGPDIFSPTVEDMFFTSMNDRFVGKNYPDMYGVVIHANIISMILNKEYCSEVPFWLSSLLIYLFFYSTMVFFTFLREKHYKWYESVSILLGIVQLVALLLLMLFLFSAFNISMEIEGVFFGVIFSKQAYEIWNDSFAIMIIEFMEKRNFPAFLINIIKS